MKKLLKAQEGQSIILIAVLLVVLIAFVGLTSDTGKAFARQRAIQASASNASTSGMNSVMLNMTDSRVQATIRETVKSNSGLRIQQINVGRPVGTERDVVYYTAEYLNQDGEFVDDVGAQPNSRPMGRGASYIRIRTYENVSTVFSRVVGQQQFRVSAVGAAGRTNCIQGVYPITFHELTMQSDAAATPPRVAPRPMPDPYADSSAIPAYAKFRVSRSPSAVGAPGNFLWLTWLGGQSASDQADSLSGPGNLNEGFTEATPPPNDAQALQQINGKLEIGDWMKASTGNVSSVSDILEWHKQNKTLMILPLHNSVNGNGSNATYRASRFVKVRLIDFQMGGNDKYFEFGLVGTDVACSGDVPPPTTPPNVHTFRIRLDERLQWFNPSARPSSFDVAIVADYSGSMRECYTTHSTCSQQRRDRRIDYQTPVLTRFVNEMLVVRNQQQGADNRLAFVTFGHNVNNRNIARTHITFADPQATALQKFSQLIGTAANPRTIPDSELNGGTPTAAGLAQALPIFQATRRYVDANGNPVNLAVLLLTDGLANVFIDAPYAGIQNHTNNTPFRCTSNVPGVPATDNPLTQSTCPAANHPQNTTGVRPPIIAAVDQGNQLRALSDPGRNSVMKIYAVLLGQPNGNTPQDLRLHQMADATYAANNPDQLNAMVQAISSELGRPCREGVDPPRAAAGATVRIYSSTNASTPVWQGTTNAQGAIVTDLPSGQYRLTATHNNVISPNDPRRPPVAYNYGKILIEGEAEATDGWSFAMPAQPYTAPDGLLMLSDPNAAKCPN